MMHVSPPMQDTDHNCFPTCGHDNVFFRDCKNHDHKRNVMRHNSDMLLMY